MKDIDWYEVTRAGFEYVDEQCDAYLASLYRIRRDRDAVKAQLYSVGETSTAILGFTGAAQKAILITAASFGLAADLTDNASSSLLFAMDPSDVQTLVKNQANAYRAGVAAQRQNYNTSNAAMEGIRGYLNLCLPVSIEAQVRGALQGTVYVAQTTGFGVPSLNRVQTASVNIASINPSQEDIKKKAVPVPQKISVDALSGGLLPGDVAISKSEVKELQKKLCVKDDGDIGGVGSATRAAIKLFQQTAISGSGGILDAGTKAEIARLSECKTEVHRNIYEHYLLSNEAATISLKKTLRKYVQEKAATFPALQDLVAKEAFVTGPDLNADNRKVITEIQKANPGMVADGSYNAAVAALISD
ncbi:hypothetical protein HFN01_32120 [Rhizobium leguminosarum]|uniref:peptidoglycan-binding domain-containing protein n=1 Tax=Rhizobium leguminosarum TaxID=384 RepID=UPI001C9481B7|nr:hypothetical protein [Rhizobium leguminosarum]MBY5399453.1 hypothetical protein [Rhizobium leguminosarum]